jgi:hypothetical protein
MEKTNGGEGVLADGFYLVVWRVEEVVEFNHGYKAEVFAPGLFLFGSDGSGEGFAFDSRILPTKIVSIPFIGMELDAAVTLAASFEDFLRKRNPERR